MNNDTNKPMSSTTEGLGLPPIPSAPPMPIGSEQTPMPPLPPAPVSPTVVSPTTVTTTTVGTPTQVGGLPPIEIKTETTGTAVPVEEKPKEEKPKKKVNKKLVIGGVIAAIILTVVGVSAYQFQKFSGEQRSRASGGCADGFSNVCQTLCYINQDPCPAVNQYTQCACVADQPTAAPTTVATETQGASSTACVTGSHPACTGFDPGPREYQGSQGNCFYNGPASNPHLCGWNFNEVCTPGQYYWGGTGLGCRQCNSTGTGYSGQVADSFCPGHGTVTATATVTTGVGGASCVPGGSQESGDCCEGYVRDTTTMRCVSTAGLTCSVSSVVACRGAVSGSSGAGCASPSYCRMINTATNLCDCYTPTTATVTPTCVAAGSDAAGTCCAGLVRGLNFRCVTSVTCTNTSGSCANQAPNTVIAGICKCTSAGGTGPCSCVPLAGTAVTAAPTSSGACAGIDEGCDTKACCTNVSTTSTNVCVGYSNSRTCQTVDTGFCGTGTCGGQQGFRGHRCSVLTQGMGCVENGATFNSWDEAVNYSKGGSPANCGQADVICVGGDKAGQACGNWSIFDSGCTGTVTGTATQPPSTIVPTTALACVNTRIFINGSTTAATSTQMNAIKIGDTIRMVVMGNNASLVAGKFIVKINGTDVSNGGFLVTNNLTPIRSDGSREFYYDYPITQSGSYAIEGYVNSVPPSTTATPVQVASPWVSNPFPVSGIDAATAYKQPDGSVRANVFKGNRYWSYVCSNATPATCTASSTRSLTEAAASINDPNGVWTSNPFPTDRVEVFDQYVLPNGVLRSTAIKGNRIWIYNCTFASPSVCTALNTLTLAEAFNSTRIANQSVYSVALPTDSIDAFAANIMPNNRLRINIYKGGRYWGYTCGFTSDGSTTATDCTAVTTALLSASVPGYANSTTAWAAPNSFPVDGVDAVNSYMMDTYTVRINFFKGGRYWGGTCTYDASGAVTGCTAVITRGLTEMMSGIGNSGPIVTAAATATTTVTATATTTTTATATATATTTVTATATVTLPACQTSSSAACASTNVGMTGLIHCTTSSGAASYCCPTGQVLDGGTCMVPVTACNADDVDSALVCSSGTITGATNCSAPGTGTRLWCCTNGQVISGSTCVSATLGVSNDRSFLAVLMEKFVKLIKHQ